MRFSFPHLPLGSPLNDWSIADWHSALTLLMIVLAVPTFITLVWGPTAPYGRYSRRGWGMLLHPKLAWFTQEVPSLLITAVFCYSAGNYSPFSARTLLTGLFLAHYSYRSLLYPLLMRSKNRMPFSIWLMSISFCLWNGFLQGYFLGFQMAPDAPITPRVAAGAALQLFGLCNVIYADTTLIFLRKPGETGYKIPQGGMFRYVSAGNYASEILEWTGYALAAWSWPAAAFAIFVFANLAPRGAQHHQWYLQKFDNYKELRRSAVLPFLW